MTLEKNLRCLKDWISYWGSTLVAAQYHAHYWARCVWKSTWTIKYPSSESGPRELGQWGPPPPLLMLLKNMYPFSLKKDKMSKMEGMVLGWLGKSVSCLHGNNHETWWFDEDTGCLVSWETGSGWALETEMQSLGDLWTCVFLHLSNFQFPKV